MRHVNMSYLQYLQYMLLYQATPSQKNLVVPKVEAKVVIVVGCTASLVLIFLQNTAYDVSFHLVYNAFFACFLVDFPISPGTVRRKLLTMHTLLALFRLLINFVSICLLKFIRIINKRTCSDLICCARSV